MGNRQDLSELSFLIDQGKIKTVIGSRFPFSDIKKAHQLLEDNQQLGKVVITF
jgi:NADPH:quinone reductase-like Zn-dependent oxidoreductase